MIGDVAGWQHQQERRQELGEADEPEVERAPGQRVHLPTDGDGEHLVREHREDPREPEPHERVLGAKPPAAVTTRVHCVTRRGLRVHGGMLPISVSVSGVVNAASAVVSTIEDAIAPARTPNCRDMR